MPRSRSLRHPITGRRAPSGPSKVDEKAVFDSLGENCAQLRRARGLSLDALARLSGLSKGMLVEIEQKRTNPSIATLCRIANALNVGLSEVLSDAEAPARIVRHGSEDGKQFWRTPAGSQAVLIDAARVLNVGGELWRWTLAASESFEGSRHPTGTQEFVHVLSGTLAVDAAGETAQCGARETLRIRADVPHRYRNSGSRACEFVMCVVEPIAQHP